MSRVRILLVALIAAASLVLSTVPAGASVSVAKTSAFCKPIKGLSQKLESAASNSSKFNANTFKKFAAALRASGKHAPKNVKKAANTLASFYAALGSGDLSGLKSSANLSGALGTYFAYVGTHC